MDADIRFGFPEKTRNLFTHLHKTGFEKSPNKSEKINKNNPPTEEEFFLESSPSVTTNYYQLSMLFIGNSSVLAKYR